MIPRVDQNEPKCISIHGSQHKKMIQIPRPFFYGHFRPLLAQKWPFFSIISLWKKENYSKWYPEWMKMHPNVYIYMVVNIKRGFRSIGHSFMAISGHYWLKNDNFSTLPSFERRRIILNDIQSGWKWTKCIYIHGSRHKRRIQIHRPFFYGHFRSLLAQKWPFFSITSFWKKEKYSKLYSE